MVKERYMAKIFVLSHYFGKGGTIWNYHHQFAKHA